MPELDKESTNRNRKIELLKKTALIFAEKGYQACTVQEITQVLNISKGGLYWHFKSKEELYIQVCDAYCISSVKAIQSMLEKKSLSFGEFYQGFYTLLYGYLDDPVQVDLVIDFYAEAKRSKIIQSRMKEMALKREEALSQLLQRLVDEKVIEKIDVKWTSQALVSALMGLVFKFRLVPDKTSVLEEFEGFFNGFFGKPK